MISDQYHTNIFIGIIFLYWIHIIIIIIFGNSKCKRKKDKKIFNAFFLIIIALQLIQIILKYFNFDKLELCTVVCLSTFFKSINLSKILRQTVFCAFLKLQLVILKQDRVNPKFFIIDS